MTQDSLQLEDWGSFHIGGRDVQAEGLPLRQVRYSASWVEDYDPNGTYRIEQMYVQYFVPAKRRGPPLVFWPGGGMTGVNFETTPDGRPGWLDYFLRDGYGVYNTDPVERGRAGWAMYPQFFSEPVFMAKARAFESFRFGLPGGYSPDPLARRFMPGTQFPVEAFDQFVAQIVPRWGDNGPAAQAAYAELLRRIGPAVVVAFSSGATQALGLAERYPALFAGLVLVELAGVGAQPTAQVLQDLPILALYGDFLDRHPLWPGIRQAVGSYFDVSLEPAGRTRIVDLPALGMQGNSHFMMMDRNNLDIARLVSQWLQAQVAVNGSVHPAA